MIAFKKALSFVYKRYLIGAMSSMALGLFASLVIGAIFAQLGRIPALGFLLPFADIISARSPVTGAAMGVAIAWGLKSKPLVMFSSAATGAFGYMAAGAAGPIGALLAAVAGAELGGLIAGRTKVDIVLVPTVTILTGCLVGQLTAPGTIWIVERLSSFIGWATYLQPLLMGLIVSVAVGLALTAPISSAALCAGIFVLTEGLSAHQVQGLYLAAGAATAGCCAQMIGFAVSSWRENRMGGLIAQGLGTSMLQIANVLKRPAILLPPTIASAIAGMLSTTPFAMSNMGLAAGMGTSGLVGQLGTFQVMTGLGVPAVTVLWKIALLHLLLPAAIALLVSELMRRAGWIRFGDMKLDA